METKNRGPRRLTEKKRTQKNENLQKIEQVTLQELLESWERGKFLRV